MTITNTEKQQGLKFGDRAPAARSDIAFEATPQYHQR